MGQLHVQRSGALLTLTLDNRGKANALDLAMLQALDAQIAAVQSDGAVRAVLLRGMPGGTFSSGADIDQWGPMAPDEFARDWIAYGNGVFDRFERLRCPSVAVIEGACFGGGLELALCADLRVAGSGASFRFPEAGIGAMPGWQGGPRLARLAGRGRALEAVLTTCTLDAQRASDWGLLNALWQPDRIEQELAALAATLCSVSPQAATLAKQAILWQGEPGPFHADAGERLKASADAAIGLQAFRDKSKPVF